MAVPRILIADDEQIARENLEHVLLREGYEIVSAGDGLAAIQQLEREEFDLVLTDIRMQPVDGFQVLERARELYPNIEVISHDRICFGFFRCRGYAQRGLLLISPNPTK